MTDFYTAWEKTGRAEGGYVDDPDDSGGKTNHGITEKVARAHGYKGDMRYLPKGEATEIAKKEYWDVLELDDVAEMDTMIAQELFDTGFNMGPGVAAEFLQRSLNGLNRKEKDYDDIVVDGDIGNATLNALDAYFDKRGAQGRIVLHRLLNALQGARYLEIVEANEKNETFLFGWLSHRVLMR